MGRGGFERQVIDEDCNGREAACEAGAVLVAKLTLGALALGDHWFGGITRNPWNPRQGSSGSSRVQLRLRPPGALHLAWDQRRLARFLRRLLAAVALGCAQLSVSCRAPGPWRFPGAWTSLGPFAEAWKTAP